MTKKFRTVVIHFGADKTGSTAVQDVLAHSTEELLSGRKMAYPVVPTHHHDFDHNQGQLGSCFAIDKQRYPWNFQQAHVSDEEIAKRDDAYMARFERWLEECPPCRYLVISYEGFTQLEDVSIQELRAFCLRYAKSAQALMYVRSPLSYACSGLSQLAKTCVEPYLPVARYREYLEKIVGAFGKRQTKVREFSREKLARGDIITDFVKQFGVSTKRLAAIQGQVGDNASVTASGFRFSNHLRALMQELQVEDDLSMVDFMRLYGNFLHLIPGEKIRLTSEQANLLAEATREDTKYLYENFRVRFKEPPEKFISDSQCSEREDALLRGMAQLMLESVDFRQLIKEGDGAARSLTELSEARRDSELTLDLKVHNESNADWKATKLHPVGISYQWRDENNAIDTKPALRTPFPDGCLQSKESAHLTVQVATPDKPGDYRLTVMPVQDDHAWFNSLGFQPVEFSVKVA